MYGSSYFERILLSIHKPFKTISKWNNSGHCTCSSKDYKHSNNEMLVHVFIPKLYNLHQSAVYYYNCTCVWNSFIISFQNCTNAVNNRFFFLFLKYNCIHFFLQSDSTSTFKNINADFRYLEWFINRGLCIRGLINSLYLYLVSQTDKRGLG